MANQPEIFTAASLGEFFKDRLVAAREHQKLEVQAGTEFYLVNLLSEFLSSEQLYRTADHEAEPLAFMLKRAQESQGFERVRELKTLGDTSLYVSGFFADSFERKLVDIDYYISMGGRAYSHLSEIFQGGGAGPLYTELAQKFVKIVDLLSEVSERAALGTNKGVVRLYERFVKTGSERMARLLAEQGLMPMAKPGMVQ
jgi:hypothetical protein